MIRKIYRWFQTSRHRDEMRRGAMRSALFTGAMLLVSCRGGMEAVDDDVATAASGRLLQATAGASKATAIAPATTTPSFLGLNLTSAGYYSGEQVYINLLIGTSWVMPGAGWADADPVSFDSAGNVINLPSGGLNKILSPPISVLTGAGATIRCTWTGTGTVGVGGIKSGDAPGDHSYEFRWTDAKAGIVYLELRASSANDPVRNLDCREKGVTGNQFSPEFIAYLKPFGVLRFMDWGATNDNKTFRWSTRTMPTDLMQSTTRGVALENMVSLANQVGADPWVNVPWNADADYVLRMAQLIHDGVPATRRIYVEVANEVWNPSFDVMHQAEREGLAEGLATSPYEASLRRYAEKTAQVMRAWTQVFADRPGQLIRVASAQHFNPSNARIILSHGDTANWVDALATAPYFGFDLFSDALAGATDTSILFPALNDKAQTTLQIYGTELQALTRQYGKRLIAYEAGQHILAQSSDPDILGKLNRDPRMYDVYRNYLATWKTKFNDTMVLFNSTGSISQYGAWGIREYAGQPLEQTPKLRAALDTIAGK